MIKKFKTYIKETIDLSEIDPYGEEVWDEEEKMIYKYHSSLIEAGVDTITDIEEVIDYTVFRFSITAKKLSNGKKIHTFTVAEHKDGKVELLYSFNKRCDLILDDRVIYTPVVYVKAIVDAIEKLLDDIK